MILPNNNMKNYIYKKENFIKSAQIWTLRLLLFMMAAAFYPAKAQVVTYTFASSSGTYTPIAGTTIFTGTWDDGASALLTIPFTFNYNNINYTTLSATANGFITMGAITPGTVYCGLQQSPPNSIAGYGTDLVSSTGVLSSVQYATTGTAPNRQFVVQWTNCQHYSSGGVDHWDFQVIINETSNTVQVVWGSSTDVTTMGVNNCGDVSTESGNVGLLGSSVSDFNIRSVTNGINTWATSVAGGSLNDVCNMSSTNTPASGLTYTWTPVPPTPMVYISSTTVFQNNMQDVGQGATGNVILQVQVVTLGILSPFDLTSLDLSTAGCTNAAADIANAKVYYTGNSSSFNTANQFGSTVANPNGAYTVNGTATLSYGTNYFWVAYDITPGAVIDDTLSGCCTQITGTGTMGAQVPTVTCPAGFQVIAEIGFWTPVATLAPDSNAGVMILLSDGTVLCKTLSGGTDGIGNIWDKLTPDINGSYVNGTWSQIAPMHDTRLYYSTQVLKDGRVYVAGGEYGTGNALGEVYDPLTNLWTMTPTNGESISDANSEILPDGKLIQAMVSFTFNLKGTEIYDPVANTYTPGPLCLGSHNESAWVKLPDSSILFVDIGSTNSERYIPSLNQWIVDGTVPVALYDVVGSETGAAFLLPDGRAFFMGATQHTAYYTPSGNVNPGTWAAGPDIPNQQAADDAPAAMMVNGKILCAVSPDPTISGSFVPPTTFYEFDYLSNSFTSIKAPDGTNSMNIACYKAGMLDLPNGTVLYSQQQDASASQYYVYTPAGAPLAAGKPTISGIIQNSCDSFMITGTLFNGISEGSAYGDDWQNATNYPIIRLTSGTNVYYARSYNWNSTCVMTGNLPDTTYFTLQAGMPAGNYSLVVIANGIASDTIGITISFPSLSSTLNPPAICSNTLFTYTPTSATLGATFTWTRAAVAGISNPAIIIPQTTDPNEVLINTTSNPISVVYLYVTSANGCSGTDSVTVVVNPAFTSISGTSSICLGDSTTLTASGGTSYVWNTSDTTVSITVSPVITTIYSVTSTNSTGCPGGTDSIEVTVNPLPVVDFTGLPDSICSNNGIIVLTGNPPGGTFTGTGIVGTNYNPVGISGNDTITYVYSDSLGCSNFSKHVVFVNPGPLPTITASGSTTFCQGDSVTLSTGIFASYIWSNSSTMNSITVNSSGIYTVTVTDNISCTGSDTIAVVVNPLPNVTFTGLPDTVCINIGNVALTGNPPGGTFSGAGVVGNIFNPAALSQGNDTVIYTFTDGLGCENSATHVVYVDLCLGIEETLLSEYAFNVYPNPAEKVVTISFTVKEGGNYVITLNDVLGRTVKENAGKATKGTNSYLIHLDGIAKGAYSIILSKGDDLVKTKLVIE
jgi:hypothetical protein